MAADTSVTHTIFFVASIIVASSLAGVFIGISYSIANTIDQRENLITESLQSDIAIINDPAMVPYENSNLTIYVKNTGTMPLFPNGTITMIDGTFADDTSISLLQDGATKWNPSQVIEIRVNCELSSGDHQAKVVISNGVFDLMEFRI